jgi:hypothetical protein
MISASVYSYFLGSTTVVILQEDGEELRCFLVMGID